MNIYSKLVDWISNLGPLLLACVNLNFQYSVNLISNGNRTEWSPFRSVIIRVINKITSMITNRIEQLEVLLQNYDKI